MSRDDDDGKRKLYSSPLVKPLVTGMFLSAWWIHIHGTPYNDSSIVLILWHSGIIYNLDAFFHFVLCTFFFFFY